MERVARHAVADDFGVYLGAARLGVLVFFENDDARAFAHEEAVAVPVVGSRRALRFVVEVGREGPACAEAGDGQTAQRRFRAARHHHVGVAKGDEPRGVADGVRAGGAGRHHRVIRPLEAEPDGDVARGKIDQPARNEERADALRAFFGHEQGGLLDALQAADARADQHARAVLLVGGLGLPARVFAWPPWRRAMAKTMNSSTLRCSLGSIHWSGL